MGVHWSIGESIGLQLPLTNHPQNPHASPGIHHWASSGVIPNASLGHEGFLPPHPISTCMEENCQGNSSAALSTSFRPQQPKIAGRVPPALATPSPRLALHSVV